MAQSTGKGPAGGVDAEQRSLEHFYAEHPTADLSNCDREPVHFIGAVQAVGAALVIDPQTRALIAWSDNVERKLGVNPVGARYLDELLPDIAGELASDRENYDSGQHVALACAVDVGELSYPCLYHEHNGRGVLEFWPAAPVGVAQYRETTRQLRQWRTRILAADTFEYAAALAAQAGRALLGFARVKIYEFQPDGAGRVIAEARADHMPSYLGLFFPESDIPKQARFLAELVPYRTISTSADEVSPLVMADAGAREPLDLSWAVLRAASVMHTKYLRNMGVAATFTASLLRQGSLWGLIACHHDEEAIPPFDLWGVMEDVASALMSKLAQQRAEEQAEVVERLRSLEERLFEIARSNGSLESALVEMMPMLRTVLRADGFAFRYGTHMFTDGQTPPREFIDELVSWASDVGEPHQSFVTDSLPRQWPAAQAHAEKACGVLIEPINLFRTCHLIWFRAPVTKLATWAGDPHGKARVEEDGTRTLLPRNSFAAWSREHRDESLSWSLSEVTSAREILKTMLDIVANQVQLVRSNQNMETFSYAAAHDLKAPVRHISITLDALANEDPDVEGRRELLEMATQASDQLGTLIDGMVRYLVLDGGSLEFQAVDLTKVLARVGQLLGKDLPENAVEVGALPAVSGAPELLVTLFLNLIQNSIKYRAEDRDLKISVSATSLGSSARVLVDDNGPGIPADLVDKVFEPLFRVRTGPATPGAGLGLAICRRIAELHNGSIEVDGAHGPGTRIIITLPLAR